MKSILEISKEHFIDYKKNYLIYVIISLVILGIFYLSFQEYYSDLFYTAFYAIIAIPIFGIIIINKSTYLYKAIDITHKKLRMIAMIVFPPIPVLILTLAYYQIRMQNWNVGDYEALNYALVASFVGFLALLIVFFIFTELKRWTPSWPVFFGKFAMLTLYFLVIFVYPIFYNRTYEPIPYYMEIAVVMLALFIAHITTYILSSYSKMEY